MAKRRVRVTVKTTVKAGGRRRTKTSHKTYRV